MPLNDHLPVIDNRRYEDIIAEVRTRIASYSPEWKPVWSDVNDSDPGITLTQVFAWLTEMLIYRLGQVPLLNYLKFLELLGIELNPAQPAKTEITFPVLASHPEAFVIVPPRTQAAAESDDGEGLNVFETERALYALKAKLAAVQVFDGYAYTNVSTENEESELTFEPFGPLGSPGSACMLGFEDVGEFPAQVEIDLAFRVIEESSAPAVFNCSLPDTGKYPSARLIWEFWNGREWQPLNFLKDETLSLTTSGHIFLKSPPKGDMQKAVIGDVSDELFWIRGRLDGNGFEKPPKLQAVRTNSVPAIQAQTVNEEILGGSDGSPNQIYELANSPVIQDSLILEVDEGPGFQPWTRTNDFFGSSSTDQHYTLNRTTGEIRFGDGFTGKIPVGNVSNPGGNVVARQYRFGGGRTGNVAPGEINTLLTTVEGVDENGLGNFIAAFAGRDEETLKEATRRARQSIQSKCRAVTEKDFEHLAMQAADIKRAKAISLYHPNFPDIPVPGVVTVIVVPDSQSRNPQPTEGTLRTVCEYLNQRRLLTTELFVIRPTYRLVKISADVIAEDDADLAEVKNSIDQNLLDFFHPLKGGEDGQGWPFGGDIFYSRVYQKIFDVGSVHRIENLSIELDDENFAECTDVPIPNGALVYSTEHDIRVNYSFTQ